MPSQPPRSDDTRMRVGLGQFMEPIEKRLRYIKQLGVDDILLDMYQYDPDYEHMPDDELMPRAAASGRSRT